MKIAFQPRTRIGLGMALAGSLPLLLAQRSFPSGDSPLPEDQDRDNRNLQNLLSKANGDAMALASTLLGENATLRGERRSLRDEINTLKGKVPSDGVVILTPEQKQQWEAYQALGKPDEVKTKLAERDTFEAENKGLKETTSKQAREKLLGDVAAVAGYKASVLTDRDRNTPGLNYAIKDATVDGQTVKQVFVTYRDGEGENAPVKEQALTEFAKERWADFLPSLQADSTAAQGANGGAGGTRHVPQGGGGKSAGGTVFETIRKNAEERNKTSGNQGPALEQRMGMPQAIARS